MKYPDFVCLGVQKSGTTSLYRYLCEHPQVIPNSYKKEVKFWNYVYEKGLEWYKSCFPNEQGKITGDVTSNYFWYVNPEVMHKDLPETTKILVILRNPVDRMYSFYHWLKKFPCEKHPIKDSFEKSVDYFIEESDYLTYLKKWIDIFGKDRVHVIIAEELFQIHPERTWFELCDFLGIDRVLPRNLNKTLHLKQNYEPMSNDLRRTLDFVFHQSNQELFDYLNKENIWNAQS